MVPSFGIKYDNLFVLCLFKNSYTMNKLGVNEEKESIINTGAY
jgi:hypothetical protein